MEAHEAGRINFVGNVEGREALSGVCDVLVCDGFTGNVMLKTIEGAASFLMRELKDIMYADLKSKLAALALKPGMMKLKKLLDYKEVGGAPMLGISKTVVKAHGSSNGQAICNAVGQAIDFERSGFIQMVEANIDLMTLKEKEEV